MPLSTRPSIHVARFGPTGQAEAAFHNSIRKWWVWAALGSLIFLPYGYGETLLRYSSEDATIWTMVLLNVLRRSFLLEFGHMSRRILFDKSTASGGFVTGKQEQCVIAGDQA